MIKFFIFFFLCFTKSSTPLFSGADFEGFLQQLLEGNIFDDEEESSNDKKSQKKSTPSTQSSGQKSQKTAPLDEKIIPPSEKEFSTFEKKITRLLRILNRILKTFYRHSFVLSTKVQDDLAKTGLILLNLESTLLELKATSKNFSKDHIQKLLKNFRVLPPQKTFIAIARCAEFTPNYTIEEENNFIADNTSPITAMEKIIHYQEELYNYCKLIDNPIKLFLKETKVFLKKENKNDEEKKEALQAQSSLKKSTPNAQKNSCHSGPSYGSQNSSRYNAYDDDDDDFDDDDYDDVDDDFSYDYPRSYPYSKKREERSLDLQKNSFNTPSPLQQYKPTKTSPLDKNNPLSDDEPTKSPLDREEKSQDLIESKEAFKDLQEISLLPLEEKSSFIRLVSLAKKLFDPEEKPFSLFVTFLKERIHAQPHEKSFDPFIATTIKGLMKLRFAFHEDTVNRSGKSEKITLYSNPERTIELFHDNGYGNEETITEQNNIAGKNLQEVIEAIEFLTTENDHYATLGAALHNEIETTSTIIEKTRQEEALRLCTELEELNPFNIEGLKDDNTNKILEKLEALEELGKKIRYQMPTPESCSYHFGSLSSTRETTNKRVISLTRLIELLSVLPEDRAPDDLPSPLTKKTGAIKKIWGEQIVLYQKPLEKKASESKEESLSFFSNPLGAFKQFLSDFLK